MLARFIPRGSGIPSINVKVNERNQPTKIHHDIDIEKVCGAFNLDKFINKTSFQ